MKVFVAHNVTQHTQGTPKGAVLFALLEALRRAGVSVCDPEETVIPHDDFVARFHYCMNEISTADVIVVEASGRLGLGVGAEMMFAKQCRIPIFAICPRESYYRKTVRKAEVDAVWLHPFIYGLATKVFSSVDECVAEITSQEKRSWTNPGYDEGYAQCPRFWGQTPAVLVQKAIDMFASIEQKTAIDLGCGDGKNAVALARAGFRVVALDKSEIAVRNAINSYGTGDVSWLVADLTSIEGPPACYDLVIATGSLHCLASDDAIVRAIKGMQRLTKPGGLNVVSAFDDGPQDMEGHDAGFRPTLMPHARYVELYSAWEVIDATTVLQADEHPHNRVPHHHSITRLLARRALVA